jgi:hypothetical protein
VSALPHNTAILYKCEQRTPEDVFSGVFHGCDLDAFLLAGVLHIAEGGRIVREIQRVKSFRVEEYQSGEEKLLSDASVSS